MSVINEIMEIQEFATLPPVAAKVLMLLENDDVDIRDISHVIETDASLTMKLLRVANSPIYAIRTQISSIHQAILTLGLNRLTNIVIGVSIFSRFLMNTQKQALDFMEKFWWHSSCTGVVAKVLSGKLKKQYKEYEFIGGLLHDIGKLAMVQFNTGLYIDVLRLINEEKYTDVDAEIKIFGVDHLEVGEKIFHLWKLPSELSYIVSHHSKIDQLNQSQELVSIIRVADLLCEMWGAEIGEGFEQIKISEDISWRILCEKNPILFEMDVEKFTFDLESEFKKSREFLNLLVQE